MTARSRRDFLSQSIAGVAGVSICSSWSIAGDHATSADAIVALPVVQLATQLRDRHLTSVQVVHAYLDRIDKINGKLNAIVQIRRNDALREAELADRATKAGKADGPLHGVPFTIKDNIETAGIVTTCGMTELKDYVPDKDAEVVHRLKSAGGILLGKTNVPEFCLFPDTNNTFYGRSKNPHDLSRMTGGSSGGEGAIVAACGSAFGIGTDIGGSIRMPSHYCGIAGLKPTHQRVSESGVLNCFPPANWNWNATGPMARTVADLRLVLDSISGTPVPNVIRSTDSSGRVPEGLRIAYITEDAHSMPDDDVVRTVQSCANHLRDVGHKVSKDMPKCFSNASDVWWFGMNPDLATTFRMWKREYGEMSGSGVSDDYLPIASLFLRWQDVLVGQGRYTRASRFKNAIQNHEFQKEMSAFMQGHDVILCPVTNAPAPKYSDRTDDFPPLEDAYEAIIKKGGYNYLHAFNILGWPSVVVPVSKSNPDGLPIAVQIVGKPWTDSLVLSVAELIETKFGGWTMPTGV